MVQGCDNFNGGSPDLRSDEARSRAARAVRRSGCPAPVFALCQEAQATQGASPHQRPAAVHRQRADAWRARLLQAVRHRHRRRPAGAAPRRRGHASPGSRPPASPGSRPAADAQGARQRNPLVAKPSYQALEHLDEVTRRLRRECPWDREQDERSIVPHTVEEAYELADAAAPRRRPRLVDELGDVLFQVHFLSLLLEERGAGDLAAVAESCAAKLIRRHPHVLRRPASSRPPARCSPNWDEIKREVEGRRATSRSPRCPRTCRRCSTRARSCAGSTRRAMRGWRRSEKPPHERTPGGPRPIRRRAPRPSSWSATLLLEAVAASRRLGVDPELALRQAARRVAEAGLKPTLDR